MGIINFNKVISYSMTMCKIKSIGRCAEYVKKAFQAGMDAVRKDNASFKGIVIRLYMLDPDTNKMVTVEKATI